MNYELFIGPALWVVALGIVAWFGIRKNFRKAGIATVVALIVVPSIGIVPAGHRGVVYSVAGGVQTGERGEGVTFVVPWFQHLKPMSVRTQVYVHDEFYAQTLDLQEATVPTAVNFRVDPARAAELYRDVGADYTNTVVKPAIEQHGKAEIGRVNAVDFARTRGPLAERMRERISAQLEPYGIIVEYVNVSDAVFDPDFVLAVKNKIIADEKAAEEARLVEAERHRKAQEILKARARAHATRIEARAQARANTRIARTLTPQMVRWRWIQSWDGMVPQVVAGEGTRFLITPPER